MITELMEYCCLLQHLIQGDTSQGLDQIFKTVVLRWMEEVQLATLRSAYVQEGASDASIADHIAVGSRKMEVEISG